ncbi:hypothetical protein NC661_20730 [Aquibacillus koreensis]|uniref:Uncharacterized protein n=1 Tax=Aquibacillus koreensis TaxID=279446 RepID=A0A9X3WR70_9BACI|nr:hypothetical protein [Aquibacillus koreensis]MCT2535260.1 hypothetical protein [Aquibacillus koreensis]MDC3422781.1 hypothetical protein [Aquibacillus koreensis]
MNLSFYIILIVIISIVALVATLLLAGKSDQGYNDAPKNNIKGLSLIYIVTILGSIIALAVYIIFFV